MDIKFDTATMNQIVSKAIIEGLGDEQRNIIVEQAVKYLITSPPSDRYNSKPETPIQEAFNLAARSVAFQAAREVIEENPDFQAKVKELISDAANRAFSEDAAQWNGMRKMIIEALSSAMTESWKTE